MFSKKNQTDFDQSHNEPNASTHVPGSTNTNSGRGPHKSSLLNKLDPRVDSTTGQQTSGGTRNDGGALGTTSHHGNPAFGTSKTAAHGEPNNTSIMGRNPGPTNVGPHEPRLTQKIDPRVSPNMDGGNDRMSRDSGYTTQHNSGYSDPSSQTGYGAPNPMSGHQSSHLAHEANHGIGSNNSPSNRGNNSGYSDPSLQTGYGAPNPMSGHQSSHLAHEANHGIGSNNSPSNRGNITGNYNNPTGNYDSNNSGHNKPTPVNNHGSGHDNNTTAGSLKSNIMDKLDPRVNSDRDDSRNVRIGQGTSNSNSAMMPQEISSHGHAAGLSPGALEGRHAKHTSGNIPNATASATVSGGMVPEGSANASGPTSADAGTTTSNQGGLRGAMKNLTSDPKHFGHHQGESAPTNRNY